MRFAPRTTSMALLFAAAARAAVGVAAAGAWTDKTTTDGRTYKKYVPASFVAEAGLVVFFHGAGGSSDVRFAYDVEGWAEAFGFLGLVPDGSPSGGGGGGGGGGKGGGPKRDRRKLPPLPSSYAWNIEDLNGVDEVVFVQDMLATDADALMVTGPHLALGFSNGAGMASLMCCYDSTSLFVAHVGCHIDPNANFSVACGGGVVGGKRRRRLNPTPSSVLTWNGVGDGDFFLDTVGVTGLYTQFENRTCDGSEACGGTVCADETACPLGSCVENDLLDANAHPSFTCFDDPDCDKAGQLCLYNNLDHNIDPGMTATAYSYLTGNTVTAYDTGTTGQPCVGEGSPCDRDGSACCEGTTCKRTKGKFSCKA